MSSTRGGRGAMIKTPITLQDLRRRLYVKAKAEPSWRFWGLYTHVCKPETLRAAYQLAKQNDGAPGTDGVTFEAIEVDGVERFLEQLVARQHVAIFGIDEARRARVCVSLRRRLSPSPGLRREDGRVERLSPEREEHVVGARHALGIHVRVALRRAIGLGELDRRAAVFGNAPQAGVQIG